MCHVGFLPGVIEKDVSLIGKKISFQVSGGGLSGRYNFAQFHFHWGSGHTVGSEHTVSEESYPMEVGMAKNNSC